MLEEALTRLYAEILTHLAQAVKFFREKSIGEFQFLTLFISSWDSLLPRKDIYVSAELRVLTVRTSPFHQRTLIGLYHDFCYDVEPTWRLIFISPLA